VGDACRVGSDTSEAGLALLVLVATAALAWWVMPRGTWVQTGREILASALYYVNWEMISGQLAYGAALVAVMVLLA
jgi:hypothetical protein